MQWTPARIFSIVLGVAYLGTAAWLDDWNLFWGLAIYLIFTTTMILFPQKCSDHLRPVAGFTQMFPGDEAEAVTKLAWILHVIPAVLFIAIKIPEKMGV